MTLDELKASAFVVGLKETERAIDRGEAGHAPSQCLRESGNFRDR